MTESRAKIAKALAEQGHPKVWANDGETAVLSGMSPEYFRAKASDLEKAGFPKPNPWNGKRFIPAIMAFWTRQSGLIGASVPGDHDDGTDRWDTPHETTSRPHAR